jgi:hypothetical protein
LTTRREPERLTGAGIWASWGKPILAFVAGALALTVTIFNLHDRIWPPVNVRGGEVVAADLIRIDVSYVRYVQQHPDLFPDPGKTIDDAGTEANLPGVVVAVVLRLQGLRNRDCRVTYTVYRVPLRPVFGPLEALERCEGRVQDGDQGGWPAWVKLPSRAGRYFVRFDLYDSEGRLLGPGKVTPAFDWGGS